MKVDEIRIHQALADRFGHGRPQQRPDQVKDGREQNGLPRCHHPGGDGGGNGIGGVVKAVDELECQRDKNDAKNKDVNL